MKNKKLPYKPAFRAAYATKNTKNEKFKIPLKTKTS